MNNLSLKENSTNAAEIRKTYWKLLAQKTEIEVQLLELKETALKEAPELLVKKLSFKWDYKPGIHKLPKDFFLLSAAKVNQVYSSAIGGEKWAAYYGLTKTESESYSWKPQKKESN